MNTEEQTRFEVLLERIDANVKVIAEGHGALVERMDRMDARFDRLEGRFDRLELRVAVLDTRSEAMESRFEAFAADTGQRLDRIETHLGLERVRRPAKRSQRATTKRHKAR